jgi:hypothetical protein
MPRVTTLANAKAERTWLLSKPEPGGLQAVCNRAGQRIFDSGLASRGVPLRMWCSLSIGHPAALPVPSALCWHEHLPVMAVPSFAGSNRPDHFARLEHRQKGSAPTLAGNGGMSSAARYLCLQVRCYLATWLWNLKADTCFRCFAGCPALGGVSWFTQTDVRLLIAAAFSRQRIRPYRWRCLLHVLVEMSLTLTIGLESELPASLYRPCRIRQRRTRCLSFSSTERSTLVVVGLPS